MLLGPGTARRRQHRRPGHGGRARGGRRRPVPTRPPCSGEARRPAPPWPRSAAIGVSQVQAYVRRPEAADDLRAVAERLGLALSVAPWADAQQGMVSGLVVSTVPAGAADDLRHAVPVLPGTLLDVVYDPWPTVLAAQWAVRVGHGRLRARPAGAPGGPPGRADDRARRCPVAVLRAGPARRPEPPVAPDVQARAAVSADGGTRRRDHGAWGGRVPDVGSAARAVGPARPRAE